MQESSMVLFVRTITPLHVGTGRSAGFIDLEVARERATGWPVIPGSSVKGVLRDSEAAQLLKDSAYEAGDIKKADDELAARYGRRGDESNAGALCPSDLRIVLFPVRSFYGGFAYVTSPLALRRCSDLLKVCGKEPLPADFRPAQEECVVHNASSLLPTGQKVLLEDVDLTAAETDLLPLAKRLAGKDLPASDLVGQLAIVDDAAFSFFCERCTEVATKVTLKIDTKTAQDGGLRTEEMVPSEALFAGLVHFQPTKGASDPRQALAAFKGGLQPYLQFGGKSTTGQGICHVEAAE